MSKSQGLPFFVSIPHSGEDVPDEVTWLSDLEEPTLMRDVDRFVDDLYSPVISEADLLAVKTQWHRYVVDLNRLEDEFDEDSVEGAPHGVGTHPKGLHWSVTTHGEQLIKVPMTMELHNKLVSSYYNPFHGSVSGMREKIKKDFGVVYHLDLHSMPSKGTNLHPDPGQTRAEIVVSDYHGSSAEEPYRDIVMKAYQEAGFQVAYNWPYVGGGVTRRYGKPEEKCHTIQVELNRMLYMNEDTKKKSDLFLETQKKLTVAVKSILKNLKQHLEK